MQKAIGLIEAMGLSTAVAALDAASKAADVTLVGVEKVIGVAQGVGVNIQMAGEVAAVKSAVDAGVEAGNRVGKIISSHVIPRPHDEIDKLLKKFSDNMKENQETKENNKKKDSAKMKNKKSDKEE
ncbi:BMC domain-containing protein [Schnuerera sp. xch1]|uniref:BMC domain-containing protein n=1 Tax=Schnuerera sp. xch1 TaxID=2874283 RepID=UPI002958AD50|nr:BMC domain-containing protein [Schnuerera sp. xch1]MBZ2175157.1 BMC domain-containing protein [Schnuerera sp. xch1]